MSFAEAPSAIAAAAASEEITKFINSLSRQSVHASQCGRRSSFDFAITILFKLLLTAKRCVFFFAMHASS